MAVEERVLEEQVRGLGQEGDVLVAISTSGNSAPWIFSSRRTMKWPRAMSW